MNKGNLNFHNSGEKDGVFDQFKNNSFCNAWTLNMGQTYWPGRSKTSILRRVTSKKSRGLNYTAAEAWNVEKKTVYDPLHEGSGPPGTLNSQVTLSKSRHEKFNELFMRLLCACKEKFYDERTSKWNCEANRVGPWITGFATPLLSRSVP
jgi:hypothetical protein